MRRMPPVLLQEASMFQRSPFPTVCPSLDILLGGVSVMEWERKRSDGQSAQQTASSQPLTTQQYGWIEHRHERNRRQLARLAIVPTTMRMQIAFGRCRRIPQTAASFSDGLADQRFSQRYSFETGVRQSPGGRGNVRPEDCGRPNGSDVKLHAASTRE